MFHKTDDNSDIHRVRRVKKRKKIRLYNVEEIVPIRRKTAIFPIDEPENENNQSQQIYPISNVEAEQIFGQQIKYIYVLPSQNNVTTEIIDTQFLNQNDSEYLNENIVHNNYSPASSINEERTKHLNSGRYRLLTNNDTNNISHESSSNHHFYIRRSKISPPIEEKDEEETKRRRRVVGVYSRCCWFICWSIVLCTLLAAVLATVLALLLKSSSTTRISTSVTTASTTTTSTTATTDTTTTTTTTTSTCSTLGNGRSLSLNETNSPISVWNNYTFNFTATNTTHRIVFGFILSGANRQYFLDDVSVVDTSAPSNQLLQNANFENSTSNATGWIQTCSGTCSSGTGTVVNGGSCISGNCFMDGCRGSLSSIEFLEQSFNTNVGSVYTVSFTLTLGGTGGANGNFFYVDIY